MERFNITSKGYKFDKIIFWGSISIIFSILVYYFMIYGLEFRPYFVCNGTCLNPFYNEDSYSCSWAFGLKKCNIKKEEWMNQQYLTIGEYGTKPININLFIAVLLCAIISAFGLNHLLWNKGKEFHINIIDKIKKFKFEKK